MKKTIGAILLFILLCVILTCFGDVGRKTGSISMIYGAMAVLSLVFFVGYRILIRDIKRWFILLFASVFVVNTGYFVLSISRTLEAALWANRLSYLGSVFLPMSMLMIILDTCKLEYRKSIPVTLTAISIVVFLIAASPGILDIYYKDVTLVVNDGFATLEKVYGPWHCIYLFYLIAYFVATVAVIFNVYLKRDADFVLQGVFISAAVFVNMGVWLLEQIVCIEFELLSVSYIISEMFLFMLCLLMQGGRMIEVQSEAMNAAAEHGGDTSNKSHNTQKPCEKAETRSLDEQCAYFVAQRASLTPTERVIYDFYLAGKTTKEIMAELNIKENTLKYHNKNIYSKLGVSSRKQLLMIASMVNE